MKEKKKYNKELKENLIGINNVLSNQVWSKNEELSSLYIKSNELEAQLKLNQTTTKEIDDNKKTKEEVEYEII